MKCEHGTELDTHACLNCIASEPRAARPTPEALACSAWLGELEAALTTARKACERYDFRTDELMNLAAENAVVGLEELVEEERRRSPSVRLSDRDGGASNAD